MQEGETVEATMPRATEPLTGLTAVKQQIGMACSGGGRDERSVKLVAASKTVSADRLVPFLESGHFVYGENRVQEAHGKWPTLKARYPGIELHLLGPLQSNKVADAVTLFDVIQSLDRPSLAQALAKAFDKAKRRIPLFVQVNIGREPQKAGVAPDETDRFILECRSVYGFDIAGLMCIPPEGEWPATYFSELTKMADGNGLTGLSMGMSSDFAVAIERGATHVRVGSAIFGARARPTPTAA